MFRLFQVDLDVVPVLSVSHVSNPLESREGCPKNDSPQKYESKTHICSLPGDVSCKQKIMSQLARIGYWKIRKDDKIA